LVHFVQPIEEGLRTVLGVLSSNVHPTTLLKEYLLHIEILNHDSLLLNRVEASLPKFMAQSAMLHGFGYYLQLCWAA
jgi:hypothetical protein